MIYRDTEELFDISISFSFSLSDFMTRKLIWLRKKCVGKFNWKTNIDIYEYSFVINDIVRELN